MTWRNHSLSQQADVPLKHEGSRLWLPTWTPARLPLLAQVVRETCIPAQRPVPTLSHPKVQRLVILLQYPFGSRAAVAAFVSRLAGTLQHFLT